jgi:hypothetical protein
VNLDRSIAVLVLDAGAEVLASVLPNARQSHPPNGGFEKFSGFAEKKFSKPSLGCDFGHTVLNEGSAGLESGGARGL